MWQEREGERKTIIRFMGTFKIMFYYKPKMHHNNFPSPWSLLELTTLTVKLTLPGTFFKLHI